MKNLDSTLSASKARSNFYTLLNEVSEKSRRFTITLRGGAKAVVMPPEEVEAWEETLEIMSNKKLAASIKRAEKELREGKMIPEDKLLKELGISKKDLQFYEEKLL